ncbi:hypothetical protein HYPSUDRAFT_131958 [Hypholoma sublateritium FD-334 SS-4]|uniref:CTLH domain-containing protein n=1 Tax=Hypholoma sublateritium (strain FD-334 SS-4) TaxID=945553 RepID=A0A0D2LHF1_HYPSF|nr:hypothetical protein HYPSUDRAFT_131958 [Hypholoma sublateritium FD-334 SS-4]
MPPAASDASSLSATPELTTRAGPSSLGSSFEALINTNGHRNGFGAAANGNGAARPPRSIARVDLPGTALYDDSFVDREEFVRLVIQSLRDVGYVESAAALEAESGYTMEAPEVSQFRQYILDGLWPKAEAALVRLGVHEDEGLWDAKFLISQQKYLELVEARRPTEALQVLRNELAPLDVNANHLHLLSSLIMCSEPEDLRKRARWDGALGTSRRKLLEDLHEFIPSAVMIPQRRFSALLNQARAYQRQRCIYHNAPLSTFSLYADHHCSMADFPTITTTILEVHNDEVWNIAWSHDGAFLASASKDKSAIIWRRGSTIDATAPPRDWEALLILREHPYPVGCLAWSLDDTVLLTSAEHIVKMWNAKTGTCIRTLDEHTETVTAISWLPDGTGFVTGALDRRIIIWDANGKIRDAWGPTDVRITDLAVTPNYEYLVAIGMEAAGPAPGAAGASGGGGSVAGGGAKVPHRMIVFDVQTKERKASVRMGGELTSVQTSQDSLFALINHAPNEIHLFDLRLAKSVMKYAGQTQGRHVIRSCFGGIDGNFVISGSEDAKVYTWHRESGLLLQILPGHGAGSVNSVAWNPTNERMFASCSDDHTIRIWEAPPPGVCIADSAAAEEGADAGALVGGLGLGGRGGGAPGEGVLSGKGKTRQAGGGAAGVPAGAGRS